MAYSGSRKWCSLALVGVIVAFVASAMAATPAFAKVRIDHSSLTIKMGQEREIGLQEYAEYGWESYIAFDEGNVRWTSSNSSIVRIDSHDWSECSLTAIKPGKAKVKSNGTVTFKKLPLAKCGSKVKVSVTCGGLTGTRKAKVVAGIRAGIYGALYVKPLFKGKKTVKVVFTDYIKGDVLKVKIGSKTYKKRIKVNGKKTVKVKIKKSVADKKIKAILYDHFGKKVQRDKSTVWRGKYIHQGDTKKQVKMTYGFSVPDHINYCTDHEQWCYDSAYLYFYGNDLRSWQIFG